jgi:NDP-sugar pyrophosphorylase family protein
MTVDRCVGDDPSRLADATAVVLAGGLGTRLAPVVRDRQKVLATVAGRPFVTHLLDRLLDAGVGRAVLCTGYRGEQVRAALGEFYRGLRLVYSQETVPVGTAGALRVARPLVTSDPVLVLNGDSLCRVSLPAIWRWHHECRAAATIVLAMVERAERFGRVEIDDAGRLTAFEEKSPLPGSSWVNAGVYVLSRRVLDAIPGADPVSLERDVLPVWVGRGLYGCRAAEAFLDIGTPDDYAAASRWLAGAEQAG